MTTGYFYAVFETPAGWAGLLGSAAGLKQVILFKPSRAQALQALGIDAGVPASEAHFKDLVARFRLYFSGRRADFPDKLDLNGATAFQQKVWTAARQIHYGETRSYGWLAQQTGQPGAARAVGQALGRNPLLVVVPCHRVLAGDGSLGGFTGGLAHKELLLNLEKQGG